MLKLTGKNISFLQVAAIIIFGVLIYAHSSCGGFVWDDHGLINDNGYIKNWSNLPEIIKAPFASGSGAKSNYYRPLQTIVYMAGYSLWGLKTAGYHWVSILAHILAAIIFYFLLRNIFYDQTASFLASLLFLSSPINTEAVCYISCLGDPLGLALMLSSFIFYLKSLASRNKTWPVLALFSFILALLSKESAVILPLLILLYHYAFQKKLKIQEFMPFLGILTGYVVLRLTILNPPDQLAVTFTGLGQRIPVFFAGIAEYLRLLLLPLNLHVEYESRLFKFTDFMALLGLILALALITFAFIRRKVSPGFFFASGWFFIALLPVSNIYPISYGFIMEHYLYFPALGFFMVLSGLFCRPLKSKIISFSLRFLIIGLLILYAYLTFKQSGYWRQPVVFYQRTLQYAPQSWRFYNELAIEYAKAGKNSEAEAAYREAIRINPEAVGIYHNLINLYRKTSKQEKLLATEKMVNEIKLKSARQYIAQASTYVLAGRYKDAVTLLREVLAAWPDFALAYNNLAVAYYYLKQYDLAVKNCDQAIALGYAVEPKFIDLLKIHRK